MEQQTLPVAEPDASQAQSSSLFREIVETLLLAVIIILLVNTVTGRFRIDGSSMEPNLHDGEYVIVNRVTYARSFAQHLLRFIKLDEATVSQLTDRLPGPQRGDVVVFQREGKREFIKRIIGLPGETVEVRSGRVVVNGVALDEPYIAQPSGYSMEPRRVNQDEYFVLGDNRNNSSDSHTWGTIPLNAIDGKAWVTYWPPNSWGVVPHYSYAQAKAP